MWSVGLAAGAIPFELDGRTLGIVDPRGFLQVLNADDGAPLGEALTVELPAAIEKVVVSRDAERWFEQVPTNPALGAAAPTDVTGPHRKSTRSSKVSLLGGGTAVPESTGERAWLLPALIAAIALTIGMILGALLFSKDGKECAPCEQQPKPAPQAPKQ